MSGNVVRQGLLLVRSKPSKSKFRVGAVVPSSGVYQVFHQSHRVSHEVTLIKDETFPPCNKCGDKVHFELVKEVPEIDHEHFKFKIRLYEIPHPEDEEQAEETA